MPLVTISFVYKIRSMIIPTITASWRIHPCRAVIEKQEIFLYFSKNFLLTLADQISILPVSESLVIFHSRRNRIFRALLTGQLGLSWLAVLLCILVTLLFVAMGFEYWPLRAA